MEIVTIIALLATLLFGALWLKARNRVAAVEADAEEAEVRANALRAALRAKLEAAQTHAREDGLRLSQLRTQNNTLARQRDKIAVERDLAEAEVKRLEPLAAKAVAAQRQRVAASQAAKAKRAASKPNGKAPGRAGVRRPISTTIPARK